MAFIESEAFKNLMWSGKEKRDEVYENCSFDSCDFSDGLFSFCKFIDCEFLNCNLSMVKLTGSLLNEVSFRNCKMLGINFSDCNDSLFSVKFSDTLLDYCLFTKKKLQRTLFKSCSIKNADFSESDLTQSSFSNCDLLNTVFFKTVLKEADLVTASNYTIDPGLNIIRRARFALIGIPGLLRNYDIVIE